MAQPVHFRAVVEQIQRHDPDVASYRLRAEKRLPRFVPGQFIHLAIDDYDPSDFWPDSRVFSVANAVADHHTIQLTISRKGDYTGRILDEIEPGNVLWAKGPYGEFSVDGDHGYRRVVLVAGGTGITPFCAFMDATLAEGRLPVEAATLHYGARTPRLLIYRSLAEQCAAQVRGFEVRYYAETAGTGEDSAIISGRLDPASIVEATPQPSNVAFYLSGPKPMIDAFQIQLVTEHGISHQQILIDAWE